MLKVPCMTLDESGPDGEQIWVSDESVKLKPPYFISYETMAIDAGLGMQQRATAEMVNKWCLLPIFIHVLLAYKTNKSLVDTTRDPYVHRIILYVMRHHVHNHGNVNLPGHPCMTIVYEFPIHV